MSHTRRLLLERLWSAVLLLSGIADKTLIRNVRENKGLAVRANDAKNGETFLITLQFMK